MKLPLLVSVPHAGLAMPDELSGLSIIAEADIVKDGDEQAAAIYLPLREQAALFATTDTARVFVDQNRARDDFSKDGVIKTHSCWDVRVYSEDPDDELRERLLSRYYDPYHETLTRYARSGDVIVGVDCHTMAAVAPPVAPDPGAVRPVACVSDADGTCDRRWTQALVDILAHRLDGDVRLNDPFRGGYITRTHAAELPWLQLELSRGDFLGSSDKARVVCDALTEWVRTLPGGQSLE